MQVHVHGVGHNEGSRLGSGGAEAGRSALGSTAAEAAAGAARAAAAASDERAARFSNIFCAGCGLSEISSPRWNCVQCADFDLCERCHRQFRRTGEYHIQGHTFHRKDPCYLSTVGTHTGTAALTTAAAAAPEAIASMGDSQPADIEFIWAANIGSIQSVADLDVMLCEPELANEELINPDRITGKLAIAKRGGVHSLKKQR